jgi:hypothetical protein
MSDPIENEDEVVDVDEDDEEVDDDESGEVSGEKRCRSNDAS